MATPIVTKLEQVYSLGGLYKEVFGYMNGPASYTTGGDALAARDLGVTSIQHIEIISQLGDRMALPVFAANDTPETSVKILIASIAGVEVANASDQSTKKFRFRVTGLY